MDASSKTFHVLLVEDNAADAWIIRDSLSRTGVRHELIVIEDGEEASSFLLNRSGGEKVSFPDLMLLDLNLPRKSGIEILQEIKADPSLRSLPVLVLTSSGSERDIDNAYRSGANQYFRKPGGLSGIEELMSLIARCWLEHGCLPHLKR